MISMMLRLMDCKMVEKEIVSRLLEEEDVSHFRKEVMILESTYILGFLEKLELWFEQDIDEKEERYEGDEDGGEV
ncbi:hypothetical protein Tco_1554186 [Tanacetum coccineum]